MNEYGSVHLKGLSRATAQPKERTALALDSCRENSPISPLRVLANSSFYFLWDWMSAFNLIEESRAMMGGGISLGFSEHFIWILLLSWMFSLRVWIGGHQLEKRSKMEPSCSLLLRLSNHRWSFPVSWRPHSAPLYSSFVLEGAHYYSWVLSFSEGWERRRLSW